MKKILIIALATIGGSILLVIAAFVVIQFSKTAHDNKKEDDFNKIQAIIDSKLHDLNPQQEYYSFRKTSIFPGSVACGANYRYSIDKTSLAKLQNLIDQAAKDSGLERADPERYSYDFLDFPIYTDKNETLALIILSDSVQSGQVQEVNFGYQCKTLPRFS